MTANLLQQYLDTNVPGSHAGFYADLNDPDFQPPEVFFPHLLNVIAGMDFPDPDHFHSEVFRQSIKHGWYFHTSPIEELQQSGFFSMEDWIQYWGIVQTPSAGFAILSNRHGPISMDLCWDLHDLLRACITWQGLGQLSFKPLNQFGDGVHWFPFVTQESEGSVRDESLFAIIKDGHLIDYCRSPNHETPCITLARLPRYENQRKFYQETLRFTESARNSGPGWLHDFLNPIRTFLKESVALLY